MTGLTHFQGRLLLGVGAAVMIALPGNWMMQLAAFALLSAGALAWQDAARWFFYASIAADVMIFFVLLGSTPVLGAGLAHTIAATAGDVVQWITGCLLLRASAAVMAADGRRTVPEWLALLVWSAGCLFPILSACMGVNALAAQWIGLLAPILQGLGALLLIVDALFRMRK